MTQSPSHDFSFDEAGDFIFALGKAAHQYGMSSVLLESYLSQVAEALSVNGEFIAAPDFMNIILWTDDDPTQHSRAMKMPPANYDMRKLAAVRNLVHEIEASKRDCRRAPRASAISSGKLRFMVSGRSALDML